MLGRPAAVHHIAAAFLFHPRQQRQGDDRVLPAADRDDTAGKGLPPGRRGGEVFPFTLDLHEIGGDRDAVPVEKLAEPLFILLFPPVRLLGRDGPAEDFHLRRTGNLPVAHQLHQPQREDQPPDRAVCQVRPFRQRNRPAGGERRQPRDAEMVGNRKGIPRRFEGITFIVKFRVGFPEKVVFLKRGKPRKRF